MPSLHVEVRDDEIIVTQSGSNYRMVYRKALREVIDALRADNGRLLGC